MKYEHILHCIIYFNQLPILCNMAARLIETIPANALTSLSTDKML